jgi:small redox-active disulfide protein 2
MLIKVFGPGCKKCEILKQNVEAAISDLGMKNVEVKKISDINEMIEAGIMSSPTLMIDGEIKTEGKLTSIQEIKDLLKKE